MTRRTSRANTERNLARHARRNSCRRVWGRDYSQRSEGERAKVRSRKGAGAAPVVPRALWTVPTGGGIRVWTGREITPGEVRADGESAERSWQGPGRSRLGAVARPRPPPRQARAACCAPPRVPRPPGGESCRVARVSPHASIAGGGPGGGVPRPVLFLNSDRTRDTPHTPCFKVLRFGFSALRYAPPCARDAPRERARKPGTRRFARNVTAAPISVPYSILKS